MPNWSAIGVPRLISNDRPGRSIGFGLVCWITGAARFGSNSRTSKFGAGSFSGSGYFAIVSMHHSWSFFLSLLIKFSNKSFYMINPLRKSILTLGVLSCLRYTISGVSVATFTGAKVSVATSTRARLSTQTGAVTGPGPPNEIADAICRRDPPTGGS